MVLLRSHEASTDSALVGLVSVDEPAVDERSAPTPIVGNWPTEMFAAMSWSFIGVRSWYTVSMPLSRGWEGFENATDSPWM